MPYVATLRSNVFAPSDVPLRKSSTVATLLYTQTATSSPGGWSVQFIGTIWTIGPAVHWFLNRW
ncbi:MAG TPA: hypothetical protein VKD26_02185 [Streptosporangiaceae bacterium]|nr:hypothetical protein [Streptosporangiaceae bacterium]